MTFTRKEYMDKDCTHREYYGQFVCESVKARVRRSVVGPLLAGSTDEHMNDIPLKLWDTLGAVGNQIQWSATDGDWPTMAGRVCIYKEAAKQIMEDRE